MIANNKAGVSTLPIRFTSFCGLMDNHNVIKKNPIKNIICVVSVAAPPKNGFIAIS